MKKLSSLPDEEILSLLMESNPLAFTHIYVKYQAIVFAYAQKITRSQPVAEDITQDVFVKIWELRNAAQEIRHLKRYVLTMCKHNALDWLAKKTRERVVREEMCRITEEFYCDAENVLQRCEYRDLLHNAIERLPPKRKLIFKLCKLNGISYGKAAEQLEITPGTINDHIVKGTRFVKEYLKLHKTALRW